MPDETKVDLFHPQQPRIPGVSEVKPDPAILSEGPPEPGLPSPALERVRTLVPLLWFLLTVAGIATTGAGLLLWSKRSTNKGVSTAQPLASPPALPPVQTKNPGNPPVAP